MEFTTSNTYISPSLMETMTFHVKQHALIKAFVKTIDPEVKVKMSNEQFYCLIDKKKINVPFTANEEGDRLIYDFVLEKFGVSMHPLLIGICHEIGHIKTYNPEMDEDRSLLYFMIKLRYYEEVCDFETYNKLYFSIPSEYAATEWAVKFYLANKDFCDEFIRRMEAL